MTLAICNKNDNLNKSYHNILLGGDYDTTQYANPYQPTTIKRWQGI